MAFFLYLGLVVCTGGLAVARVLEGGGGVGRVSQFGMITIFPASKLDPDWTSTTTTVLLLHHTTYLPHEH